MRMTRDDMAQAQTPYNDVATPSTLAGVIIPVPPDFAYEDALKELAQLLISLLKNGMPEREIAKRLMRYHPAVEG